MATMVALTICMATAARIEDLEDEDQGAAEKSEVLGDFQSSRNLPGGFGGLRGPLGLSSRRLANIVCALT